jgi:hypothetical protein|tara:strand:- start:64414 stop:64962 length:549 start_codon:yes stop_codon:yes gene_type:complete
MPSELDNEWIQKALRRLGELGIAAGIQIELNIYGGSAMILAYQIGRRTKDVDAIFTPREEVLKLSKQVAVELSLDESWLNDEVKVFVAPFEQKRLLPLEFEGLRIQVPTANYLLTMKALAARRPAPGYPGDHSDLVFLIRKLEIHSVKEIQETIDKHFPDDVLPTDKAIYLEEIIEEVWSNE